MTTTPSSTPSLPSLNTLKRPDNLWRIILLLVAMAILLCFFLPQFYVSITIKFFGETSKTSRYLFGWSTWWGILSFILTFLVTGAIVVDLALSSVPAIRTSLRFVYLAVFGLLSATTFLGILLALFGVGLGVKTDAPDQLGPLNAMVKDMVSVFRFPIMAIPLLLATIIAAGISLLIVIKELKAGTKGSSPAAVTAGPSHS